MKNAPKYGLLLLILAAFCLPSSAIIIAGGDGSGNTNAPTGSLENSGWQWQGRFNSYLGTPIGPHHFITAIHIGGSVGNKFYYNNQVYTTVSKTNDISSDLRIWKVSERFSSYAPLYSGTDEVGKGLTVFGRGVDRAEAVTNTITTDPMTNGWKWGAYNYTQRWGTNVVDATATDGNGYQFLKMDWDAGVGEHECMLADKDSGGAAFIQDGEVWKLAGINYSISPAWTYSFNSDGSDPFNAAIIDFAGDNPLYVNSGGTWIPVPSETKSASYVSRISSAYSWITNVIGDELDQDVDLLPDWWEVEHEGSITGMVASADSDGDGVSNLDEWYSDTNPTNDTLFFDNTGTLTLTNQTFTFDGSTARQYQLLYTTNDLADPGLTWISNGVPIWGAGAGTEIVVTNTEDTVFYRVWVTLP